MFVAETVCDASGCYEQTDVVAWAGDNLVVSLILGIIALYLLGRILRKLLGMWKRPVRALVTTVVWGFIIAVIWPQLGWLPLWGLAAVVIVPLGLLLGWMMKVPSPPCAECEEYGEEYCSIHGEY